MDQWRVGTKVPINVYDGDGDPVCQCHTEVAARLIVASVNQAVGISEQNAALRKALEDAPHGYHCAWYEFPSRFYPCDCWKARIPLPTNESLAQGAGHAPPEAEP